MSAFPAEPIRDHPLHGLLFEGRHGADDENSRSNVAGDGAEDYVHTGSVTRSLAMTGCLIVAEASPQRSGCPSLRWRKCWLCIGRSISIGTCGIFTRSYAS